MVNKLLRARTNSKHLSWDIDGNRGTFEGSTATLIKENPRTLPFYYQQQFEFFLHLRSLQPQAQGYVPGEQRMQGFAPGVFNSNVTTQTCPFVTSQIDMEIMVNDGSIYVTLAMRVSS